ncbi:Uncharacterised protein g6301 [Pycnogonum litorale]
MIVRTKSCLRSGLKMHLPYLILIAAVNFVDCFKDDAPVFTACGGTLTRDKGVISTPNFPDKFPTPISCRWIIKAPKKKGVAIFFTQFYLKEGLTATEYYYYNDDLQVEARKLEDATFQHVFIESSKPTVVLEFNVKDIQNVHLRVENYFVEIYGFNITYEFINEGQKVREDTCSVSNCSYLGECFASSGFIKYECKCFDNYIGDHCQYGPSCNPYKNINSCLNGGQCRYYSGSKSNTCDCLPGYIGSRCETKLNPTKECSLYGCTQSCEVTGSGETICTCYNGYKLSDDNKQCVQLGRARYLASIKLMNLNANAGTLDESEGLYKLFDSIKRELQKILRPSIDGMKNLTILGLRSGAVVEFHFFASKQDISKAKALIYRTVSQGNLGPHLLDKNFVKFEVEPALQVQDVELDKDSPYIVGDAMKIACGAVGSNSMSVKWFKDDALVDVNRARAFREIENITYPPQNSDQKYYFELMMQEVTVHDAGLFTCQVEDWGTVQNKSIQVTVLSPPIVTVTPMTVSLREGGMVTLKCVEDIAYFKAPTSYSWSKNGKILGQIEEHERIEDLYPNGSWLHITDAKATATYSCTVTCKTGSTKRSVNVYVLSKYGDVRTCKEEEKYDIFWKESAANTFDLQPCPPNYIGIVRRLCEVVSKDDPLWQTPDFSQCMSHKVSELEQRFDTMKYGYMTTKATDILNKLWGLMKKQVVFYPGEGEPILHLLSEVIDYIEKHSHYRAEVLSVSKELMDIFEVVLSKPIMLQKQRILVELHLLIKRHSAFRTSMLNYGESEQIFTNTFGMENMKLIKSSKQSFVYLRWPMKRSVDLPSWYNDTIDLRFNLHFMEDLHSKNSSLDLSLLSYRNLTSLFPKRGITRVRRSDVEFQIASRIVSVSLLSGDHELGLSVDSFKKSLKIKLRLQRFIPTFRLNQTSVNFSCALADLSGTKWIFNVDKGCKITESSSSHTTCTCDKLGTYALLMLSYPIPAQTGLVLKYDYIAYVGSVVSLAFVVTTMICLILSYRRSKGPITLLKIQMCIAVIGAESAILHAVRQSLASEMFWIIATVIQFFLIAAFSLHFCIALQIYVDFVKVDQLRYASVKIVLIGWGFSLIIVGATSAAQKMEGFNLQSWWALVDTNYFYGFVVPVIMMSILQLLLHLIVKAEIRRHFFRGPKMKTARKRSLLMTRIFFTLMALILMSLSSITYINFEQDVFKYFFALCCSVLGVVLFLCFTVKSEEYSLFELCCRGHEKAELALENVARRSSVVDYKGFKSKMPTEYSIEEDDIDITKKQNERLQKLKIGRDVNYVEMIDVKKDLLDRISNHTGDNHYIPGPPAAVIAPDVVENNVKSRNNIDIQVITKPEKRKNYGIDDDSRSDSPFELQLLDNSPRSSIYRPNSRNANVTPNPPWNILDPAQNDMFKCSDSDSYRAESVGRIRPCPLHSHISNQSSDVSQSDYSDSTSSSIDFVNPLSLKERSSPYNSPFMTKLIHEETSSESDEDISESTVKHISKSPSPQKSFGSPSKSNGNRIGRLSEDPAILAYSTSPKMRKAPNTSNKSMPEHNQSGQNTLV